MVAMIGYVMAGSKEWLIEVGYAAPIAMLVSGQIV